MYFFCSSKNITVPLSALAVITGLILPVDVRAEALDRSDDSPSFQQIARMMQKQNPRQADQESNQCFLEIMDVKEDILNQPFPLPKGDKSASLKLKTRPVSSTREHYR